jgi:aminoglycoside phosphotransferase (APT) family kinase protein|tara:strand:- start:2605 stop:2916 length:312 start_codon:yes stop_codon:yes gene_type:complete
MTEFIEETVNQRCVCKSNKMQSNIIIEKELGGFIFFVVKVEKGSVPKELNGRYSSMIKAKKAVGDYLKDKRETSTTRRENFGKEFDERKKVKDAAELKSKDSQ